jgi:glycosyltransferase involved in cell wall biosynthesis
MLARVLPNEIIVNSEATGQTLGLRVKSNVVPSPIAQIERRPDTPAGTDRAGVLRIAMLGRLAPWKGQDVFLDAFAWAFPEGGGEAVIAGTAMFGEDDYSEALRAQVLRLGIQDRVDFTGFVDDVGGLLWGVDVVVHASVIAEPFGQVVVQGMAAGKAVVASAAGGPMEIITDEVDGILVPPGDREALAAALSRLASDRALRERLGAAGPRRAECFRPAVVAGMIEKLYEEVLERRRSRHRGWRRYFAR